ncbi:MAG: hypothetical protein IJZ56_01025 [Oscillospiraceae bacterium]|nr:hypothetical protein [Oscillospiraceae bacterium]
MKQYIETLNKYAEEQGVNAGTLPAETVIDVLFACFCLENEVRIPAVSAAFEKMESVLEKLSLEDNDKLFLLTCQISETYRREAFRTGLLAGFHLCKELAQA